jgi:acetyl-CoA carboxylase biotin carboxylase subunit
VKHIGYLNAGTMEFLLDQSGNFYFMEINARIQVEHPVTEMVTGVDLIKEQFKIAMGEPLVPQDAIHTKGWAIECRINAEDPDMNFLPCPGIIETLFLPDGPGVRVDTHIYAGYEIPIYYDTLLAKLIAHAETRDEAVAKMSRCLDEFVILPTSTTISFHKKVLRDADFIEGRYDTGFVSRYLEAEQDEDD